MVQQGSGKGQLEVGRRWSDNLKALKYEDEYQEALDCFLRASAMEPEWSEPREKATGLWRSLAEVSELIELRGKLRRMRFDTMRQSLNTQMGEKGKDILGPYAGGSFG